ncbi:MULTISPECIES: TetR/AcrR family transcriptional regulator [unclassified Plantibacter]|uniref:TetR/AcrR family transcriptional regulator n=1 Tax=unclassified Plantibacter TaxID=2624265 RepID=UPI003D34E0B7
MSAQTAVTDRITRGQVDKFGERRDALADAALLTLSELGYARTSLRDIAQNSDFSHGVLHYYFEDKVDLITYCVRRYKTTCVKRYDEVFNSATTAAELRMTFANDLATTLVNDAPMHRLWYDVRSQSLFESAFRADVVEIDSSLERMIGRIVERYAELRGTMSAVPSSVAYGTLDGLFVQGLLKHLSGDAGAPFALRSAVEDLLPRLMLARA